jgi:hypothetical protein
MKKDNPNFKYAYSLEDPRDRGMADEEKEMQEKGADLKIDRMFIQTPTMAKYY